VGFFDADSSTGEDCAEIDSFVGLQWVMTKR